MCRRCFGGLNVCSCARSLGCSQAWNVAVSGSFVYVAAHDSDSLAVVDVSTPSSPVVVGSVVDSTYMNGVSCCAHERRQLVPCASLACVHACRNACVLVRSLSRLLTG